MTVSLHDGVLSWGVAPSIFEQIVAVTRREQVLLARASGYGGLVSELPDKPAAIAAAANALSSVGARYALIGGLAVGLRSGVPRATLDVDLAIESGADKHAITEAMRAEGLALVGSFAHSINFRHPSGEPVQLAFDEGFDPMILRAEPVAFGELTVPVVTREDLIAMKRRLAADPKRRRSKALRDQADIALLEGDVGGPDEGW